MDRNPRRIRSTASYAMVTLVVAVAYSAAAYLGRSTRLRLLTQNILRSTKRIYGVPELRFYAVTDSIKQSLSAPTGGLGPPVDTPESQFLLVPFYL